jgi:hypothetical protein
MQREAVAGSSPLMPANIFGENVLRFFSPQSPPLTGTSNMRLPEALYPPLTIPITAVYRSLSVEDG